MNHGDAAEKSAPKLDKLDSIEAETQAMQSCFTALDTLTDQCRQRVLTWVTARFSKGLR